MKSLLLGTTGLRVSEACLGAGGFAEPGWGSDHEVSRKIFDTYVEAGGRFIDVANVYAKGRAEELVGAFSRDRRDELVIGTKYTAITRPGDINAWGSHRKNLKQSLRSSLARLGTDYIDVMWVHAWDEATTLEEVMRALDDEVRAGTILYTGISNSPAWAVAHANTLADSRSWTRFGAVQIEYSLANRTPEHEIIPMTEYMGLGVLAWSPLAGGLLAGGYSTKGEMTGSRHAFASIPAHRMEVATAVAEIAREAGYAPAAVALAWLRQQRGVPVIPLLGARTETQLLELLTALELRLSDDVLAALDHLTAPTPIAPADFLRTAHAREYFDGGLRPQFRPTSRQRPDT